MLRENKLRYDELQDVVVEEAAKLSQRIRQLLASVPGEILPAKQALDHAIKNYSDRFDPSTL